MLPGSDLYKVKDKNTQLQQCINLLNLHLNTNKIKNGKRRATFESMDCGDNEFVDMRETHKKRFNTNLEKAHTLNDSIIDGRNVNSLNRIKSTDMKSDVASTSKINSNQSIMLNSNRSETNSTNNVPNKEANKAIPLSEMATLVHNNFDSQEVTQKEGDCYEEKKSKSIAFELSFMSNNKIGQYLTQCKDFIPLLQVSWNDHGEAEYIIKRIDYWYLPNDNPQKISREHCKIRAIKPLIQQIYKEEVVTGPTMDCTKQDVEDNSVSSGQVVKYELFDLSTNGTFYKKKCDVLNETESLTGKFKQIPKHQSILIEDGDIICLIVKRPELQELTFGFEFKVSSL